MTAPALTPSQTAERLPYRALVAALRQAALGLAAAEISCPPRQVVPMGGGGLLLSMLATAADLCVHKLVSVVPANGGRGLPTIQGRVQVLDSATGTLRLTLDGATVTGRRTAAMSMLGIATLRHAPPDTVLVIGTGAQARHHAEALQALYPGVQLEVLGRTPTAAARFCGELADAGVKMHSIARAADSRADVVVTCTTSREPVYGLAADARRLLIAVGSFSPGAAEIAAATVRASQAYVDDPVGARHEAGDLILAGVDWAQVQPLSHALAGHGPAPGPTLFKTVGCAAWDLAAARVALGAATVAEPD